MKNEEVNKLIYKIRDEQNKLIPIYKDVIDTNNVKFIRETIDYIYSKSPVYNSLCQFLFSRIYEIEQEGKYQPTDNTIDLDYDLIHTVCENCNIINDKIKQLKNVKH